MIIIPSLDIHDGKSKYSYENCYDPVIIVKSLKDKGFHHFLIVDLDGVFSGEFVHYDLIRQLKAENIYLYVGGGIRTLAIAEKIFASGADNIVVGTVAIKDQDLLMDLIESHPNSLSVAIDTYGDSVYMEGWVEESDVDLTEFVQSMAMLGVNHLIHTEINHTDNLNICSNKLMQSLSKEHSVKITPTIDVSKNIPFGEFVKCGCKEVILGGALDFIELKDYVKLNI